MGSDRQPIVSELLGPAASAALEAWAAQAPARRDPLALASFLRERLPSNLARDLAELWDLRSRAAAKFASPARVLLTRKGLEQATRLEVARWRARRMENSAPKSAIVDATCGLGADSAAMLGAGFAVVALERDSTTAAFARHNLALIGGPFCVVLGSAEQPPFRARYLFCDPDRRDSEGGRLGPADSSPGLAATLALARRAAGACVKLGPATAPGLFEDGGIPFSPTWVSAGGELRECCLWSGEFAPESSRNAPGTREAVRVAPDGGVAAALADRPTEVDPLSETAATSIRWIGDPDPSVVRAGLLGNVALRSGSRPLAAQLGYLGSDQPIDDPFVESRRVLGHAALDARQVRRLLDQHDVGDVEVRKRGHPDSAETLARRLRGRGRRRGILAVARLERRHVAYLLE